MFRLSKKYNAKVLGLIGLIVLFSIFYFFLDASHFQGINPLQDKIKDDIVEKEVAESFQNIEQEQIKKNVEEVVKDEEEKIKNPTSFQQLFDRLYFSTITSCLLGYGDIYPATNVSKFLSAFQSFLTLCIILY